MFQQERGASRSESLFFIRRLDWFLPPL